MNPLPTRAISIRQPWAWAILHGKSVENRPWSTKFRGPIFLHAAKNLTRREYESAAFFCYDYRLRHPEFPHLPAMPNLERGGIVGAAEIVDCVSQSDSPWFIGQGQFGLVLENVRPLTFYRMNGSLGLFEVDERALKHLHQEMSA